MNGLNNKEVAVMHQNEPDYAISNIVFNSIEKAPAASID
jgi:hypothetical protein